jgi:hypothetical protein
MSNIKDMWVILNIGLWKEKMMNLTAASSIVHACSCKFKLRYGISFYNEIQVSNFIARAIRCSFNLMFDISLCWGNEPNSLRNKNMERHIPYLLLKVVFLAFKTLLSPLVVGEKTFLSTLNVMILQTVKNECVRFGGHVDIEVNYKIL